MRERYFIFLMLIYLFFLSYWTIDLAKAEFQVGLRKRFLKIEQVTPSWYLIGTLLNAYYFLYKKNCSRAQFAQF